MAASTRETQASAAGDLVRPVRGRVVAVEGIDGSGKSSLAKALHARLVAEGIPTVLTREPTDGWLGQAVKQAIRESTDPFVEAFLFLADHADHVRRVTQWVQEGKVVVSDRYGDSCLAYQAATLEPLLKPRGTRALDWLRAAQRPVDRPADATLLLDVDPALALERIKGRAELVKFEDGAFLERVRRNYHEVAQRAPGYEVLDGAQEPGKLGEAAWAALQRRGIVP